MNKKLIFSAILVCFLVFNFVLIGCENNKPKEITITGIGEAPFGIRISVASYENNGENIIAEGDGDVTNGSVTVPLAKNGNRWTGIGEYQIKLTIHTLNSATSYYYTDGKTFVELGVEEPQYAGNDEQKFRRDRNNLPKIKIAETKTTVSFDKFTKW